MFGRGKKEKIQNVKTYINGEEQQGEELPVPHPPGAQALEPEQVQAQEPSLDQVEFSGDCVICFDYGYYQDSVGVWHNCPRCNPLTLRKSIGKVLSKSETDEPKPRSPLYGYRVCAGCGFKNEIHKKKKKWECESCGHEQEGL